VKLPVSSVKVDLDSEVFRVKRSFPNFDMFLLGLKPLGIMKRRFNLR